MDLPDPQQYATAFAAALRDQLTKQIVPPATVPAGSALIQRGILRDLNSDTCVFVGGRFLPRGSTPDFPRRRALAIQSLSIHTGLCGACSVVRHPCVLEFDNYGNILLRTTRICRDPRHKTKEEEQCAIYFMRSIECIAAPVANILALTLETLMQRVADFPVRQQKITCCNPDARCTGSNLCSSFPADCKARMFVGHPDDLSAKQRDGATELCNFLEEHFRSILGPLYHALYQFQTVDNKTAPTSAPEPAPLAACAQAAQSADTSREGIIASLYAQIDELKTACSRADERAAKAVARERAAQARVAKIAAVVGSCVASESEPESEPEPEPEDDEYDHETVVLIANARKKGYAPYPSKRG